MKPLAQLRLHLSLLKDRSAEEPQMQAHAHAAREALQVLEQRLQAVAPTGWVAGQETPSIADVALYPYTRLSPLAGIDLQQFPCTSAWLARVETLPGYQPLFPGQPELTLSTVERPLPA